MLALANNPTSRVELVVKGAKDGLGRGWVFVRGAEQFQSDRRSETISPDDLVDAIRRVAEGDAVFSPRLAGFVLDAFAARIPAKVASSRNSGHSAWAAGPSQVAPEETLPVQWANGTAGVFAVIRLAYRKWSC